MKRAMEAARDLATDTERREKFEKLISMVTTEEGNYDPLPEARIEEIHACLVCNGMTTDLKGKPKEDKDVKALKFNICITRNHYANCFYESEEGRKKTTISLYHFISQINNIKHV